jgi:hypothetical protein
MKKILFAIFLALNLLELQAQTYCINCPKMVLKAYLNNLNPSTMLMSDNLRTLPDFPLADPYWKVPYNQSFIHTNNDTAQINPALLSVTGNNAIVDWVFIELRGHIVSPCDYPLIAARAALIQRDGDIVAPDGSSEIQFPGVPPGNYLLRFRHRNHLHLVTKQAINFDGTLINFDFTDVNNTNIVVSASCVQFQSHIYAFPGNAALDTASFIESIDALDGIAWESANGNFDEYLIQDFNLDASVDSIDSAIWEVFNGLYDEWEH